MLLNVGNLTKKENKNGFNFIDKCSYPFNSYNFYNRAIKIMQRTTVKKIYESYLGK